MKLLSWTITTVVSVLLWVAIYVAPPAHWQMLVKLCVTHGECL